MLVDPPSLFSINKSRRPIDARQGANKNRPGLCNNANVAGKSKSLGGQFDMAPQMAHKAEEEALDPRWFGSDRK
jgi:hypothetical protein